jgi:hypothetical protein
MATSTALPRPEGHIYFSYSPMSPPNWGIAAFDMHVFVYPNIRVALEVLRRVTDAIQAQQSHRGSGLLTGHLLFRGNSDVTQRLLPTRLRGPWRQPAPRERFSVAAPPMVKVQGVNLPTVAFEPGGADARLYWGDWFERVEPMRAIEDSMAEVSQEDIDRRDALERAAVDRASQLPEVASIGPFQRRAAVRHYSRVLSPLLDVSTSPEVAAFFATGGTSSAPAPGTIGMLWGIDLSFFQDLFLLKMTSIPGGEKINMTEAQDTLGVNKRLLQKYGVLPTCLQLACIELPFPRPQAQGARFFSLAQENGAPLPAKTEFTWWSIIERRAYGWAFIQDGRIYENPNHNITADSLWPATEPLVEVLA